MFRAVHDELRPEEADQRKQRVRQRTDERLLQARGITPGCAACEPGIEGDHADRPCPDFLAPGEVRGGHQVAELGGAVGSHAGARSARRRIGPFLQQKPLRSEPLERRIMHVARCDHHPSAIRHRRQQQLHEKVMREVIDREGQAIAFGAALVGCGPVQPGIEHQNVDLAAGHSLYDHSGKAAHTGERCQIERQNIDPGRDVPFTATGADHDLRVGQRREACQRARSEAAGAAGHHDDLAGLTAFHPASLPFRSQSCSGKRLARSPEPRRRAPPRSPRPAT